MAKLCIENRCLYRAGGLIEQPGPFIEAITELRRYQHLDMGDFLK